MKLGTLKRVPPPPPVPERKACVACKAFAAECITPIGEASAPMCWLCAHHVVEHNRLLHEAMEARCECMPHEIYPESEARAFCADAIERDARRAALGLSPVSAVAEDRARRKSS